MTHTGWTFEYAMGKPLVAMYAFHRYLAGQYRPGADSIPPEYQTSSRTGYTPEGNRQEIKTYYLGDVKDDPKMQEEIENIFGVKEE